MNAPHLEENSTGVGLLAYPQAASHRRINKNSISKYRYENGYLLGGGTVLSAPAQDVIGNKALEENNEIENITDDVETLEIITSDSQKKMVKVQTVRKFSQVLCKDIYEGSKSKRLVFKWREAKVLGIERVDDNEVSLLITYIGFSNKWNETLKLTNREDCRIRPKTGCFCIKVEDQIFCADLELMKQTPRADSELLNEKYRKETAESDEKGEKRAKVERNAKEGNRCPKNEYRQRKNLTAQPNRVDQKAYISENCNRGWTLPIVYNKGKLTSQSSIRGLAGLYNLGNTCYMNSILQCLLHVPALVGPLLKHSSKTKTKGSLSREFWNLAKIDWSEEKGYLGSTIQPKSLRNIVKQKMDLFLDGDQHDAQEFLVCFIDNLHTDMNRIKRIPPYVPVKENSSWDDSRLSDEFWRLYEQRNDSLIKDIFAGQLLSRVVCQNCSHTSTSFDPFWDISVPLINTNNTGCTLYDCFYMLTKTEILSGDEAWTCPKCKSLQEAEKQVLLYRCPHVLVVHIKRFTTCEMGTYNNSEGNVRALKLDAQVDFPTEGLDLREYTANMRDTEVIYDLVAVTNHYGSSGGGHYTASCFSPEDQKWYEFDDHNVVEILLDNMDLSAAYILFYVRREGIPV